MIDTACIYNSFDTLMNSLLGSITVIIGLYILLWGKNKEMQNCVSKVTQEAEDIKEQEPHLPVIAVSAASNCS